MSSVQRRSRRQQSQRPTAGPWRLRLRWLWSRLARPFVGAFDSRRTHRRQPGFDENPGWHGNRPLIRAARYLSYAGAAIFLVWVSGALVVVVSGNHRYMFGLDDRCNEASFSCATLAGFLAPVLSIALASAVFLLARLQRVRRPYGRRAREKPQEVVQTAGTIIGDVVGRDQLCQVLIEDLRDPATRRPHVVVGGVGTGKTALLVRLTKLLAHGGAVPVPVGLRNAQTTLDFQELARERFLAEAGGRLLAGTDAEKAWRHLLRNDQIVVLADGLEEALIDGDAEKDRDNLIRLAIRRANNDGLPLVIASRPHDPLREMEAAIVDLEPLSEEAALEYIQPSDRGPSERRVDWIVETADVVETPLYLQITRQLHQTALTEYVSVTRDGGQLDTRSVDRAELRLRLLDTWSGALVRGYLGRDERTLEESKLNLVRRFGEAARMIVDRRRRKEPGLTAEPAYLELYRISASEPLYPVRLAIAHEIGAGGDEALTALRNVLGPQDPLVPPDGQTPPDPDEPRHGKLGREPLADHLPEEHSEHEECEWREKVTRAWLAPLLLGSASSKPARWAARKNLERWLQYVAATGRVPGEPDLRLSLEIALAQGLKHAANRRDQHPHAHAEGRVYLVEQAREMLRGVNFWFTRLTLMHALCLWALSDAQAHGRGRHADHKALVERWSARPDGGPEHPFVIEARALAAWALETEQPERFIWIDESGILARVGSRPATPRSGRKPNLWIPPSAGWTALHLRAQQLVADVLLLLNLAERGARPSDRAARLRRTDRNHLPPCLAGDRTPLDPTRTVGTAASSLPGSHCQHGCLFELCPYPPKGEKSYRVELTEAFCRRQRALVSRGAVRRKTAPWQGALPGDLRRFWTQMGTGRAGSKPTASGASSEAAAALADAAGRRRPRPRRRS